MRNDFFFFFFFFSFCFAIRSPNFSSFIFPFPLLFFTFPCTFTVRLFWSRSFGLGGVVLSRQYGKMNVLKAKMLRFFRTLEASAVLPIHAGLLIFIPHIVCVSDVCKCLKPSDMLRYTSVWGPFKKCLAAITHGYVNAVERIFCEKL